MIDHILFISAGAGSGKTYKLTEELEGMLVSGEVRPSGMIATTFTRLAAGELRESLRQKLMSTGQHAQAARIGQALIGTVNSVCGQLLERFAFEAGLSPDQKVLEEGEAHRLFGESLEAGLGEQLGRIGKLNAIAARLGLVEKDGPRWRDEVMTLANTARANNMAPEQVRGWGRESADTLLKWFPPPFKHGRDLTGELLEAINTALGQIDLEVDTTKGTGNYVRLLRDAQSELRDERLPWAKWVKLSKESPTKKSASAAEAVRMIAADFEKHPRFHDDIREFCNEVHQLAADTMAVYQDAKAKQGLLDFVDQEQLLYELLDNDFVQETLKDELQVLVVDEFQDTSPIQLALFMRLARLVDRVIWVGDVKQAIYGFRGSDPELMKATLAAVSAGGGKSSVLPYSWRSRPCLVSYANQVFGPAFAESLKAAEVTLEPQRPELCQDPAVEHWHLKSRNLGNRARDLARGIRELMAGNRQVVDKTTEKARPVHFGDVAVLCRTNDRLKQVASACAEAGIPVAYRRPGLLSTPEGALAMACLRRLADPRDTLASAEIRTLGAKQSPEEWLPERLAFLQTDSPSWEWGEAGEDAIPALQQLAEARAQLPLVSPSEGLVLAMLKGDVRKTALTWGPDESRSRHRLRNLDSLIEYAEEYEDQCRTRNIAATVPGLILWFNQLADREEDWQAESSDGGAVTLVTHHRAKGLEWPVVIAMDLDADVRTRLWGLTVISREDGIDVDVPLAERRLRYWPYPFGRQRKDIRAVDEIEGAEIGQRAQSQAIEETRRLLYVSLTRARDLLIIPLTGKSADGTWLDTLGADWMLPQGDQLELPDGKVIPTAFRELEAPEEWDSAEPGPGAAWVAPLPPRGPILKRDLSPSSADPVPDVVVGEAVELRERIRLDRVGDVTSLGLVLHSLIAAEIQVPDDDQATRAASLLREWGFEESVDAQAALSAARRFIEWVRENLRPLAWYPEHPVTQVLESGQVVGGFIDLLVETEEGWVIIDHKATPRPRNEWKEIAASYSGQLHSYKRAVEAATQLPVSRTFIHFPVGGGLIEVKLQGLGLARGASGPISPGGGE